MSEKTLRLVLHDPEVALPDAGRETLDGDDQQFQFCLPHCVLTQWKLTGRLKLVYGRLWKMAQRQDAKLNIVYACFARHCGPFRTDHVKSWMRELLRSRLIVVLRRFDGGVALRVWDPADVSERRALVSATPTR